MTSKEEKVRRFLMGKKSEKELNKPIINWKNSFFGQDWYLDKLWEKAVFILGFLALLWTIFEILFLHRL